MRHAIPIGLAIIALLLVLGAPFLGVKWGFPDDRVLPQSASSRQVGDQLRTDFAVDSATDVVVVIPDVSGVTRDELTRYAADLSGCPTSRRCRRRTARSSRGALVGPPSAATGVKDGSAFLTIGSTAPLFSQASETQLDRLHAVRGPAGHDV